MRSFRPPWGGGGILKLAGEARRDGLEEGEETVGGPFIVWRSLFCPPPTSDVLFLFFHSPKRLLDADPVGPGIHGLVLTLSLGW